MGLFHSGIPIWLVEWTRQNTQIALSIETGTFMGDSTNELAGAFGRCVTIERNPGLAEKARARFADRPSIEVVCGTSRTELPKVLTALAEPTLFWLDGHWSAGITSGQDDPCPVLGELQAIASWPSRAQSVVAVDDLRLFGFGHDLDPQMKHFPRLHVVLAALENMGLETFALDDVVVGIPPELVPSFMALAKEDTLRQGVQLAANWSAVEAAAKRRAAPTAVVRAKRLAAKVLRRHQS